MKNLNWLIKHIFYAHTEKDAPVPTKSNPLPEQFNRGCYYQVGYVDQLHTNLCTMASLSMVQHFFEKPYATMIENPYGVIEAREYDENILDSVRIVPTQILSKLQEKGPFLLSLPQKGPIEHAVVVTGCTGNTDKDYMIYNDPVSGAHKMMSLKELSDLNIKYSKSREQLDKLDIEAAFFKPDLPDLKKFISTKQSSTLPKPLGNIIPEKHQKHFSIEKMENPVQAVLKFLEDYTKFSPFHLNRHNKGKVKQFLKEYKDVNDISSLLFNLNKAFPDKSINNRGELCKRIMIIQKMLNQPQPEDPQSNHDRSFNP